jgi:hypothetical protein
MTLSTGLANVTSCFQLSIPQSSAGVRLDDKAGPARLVRFVPNSDIV